MARLPSPPAPFADETLSSWVQRLACTYQLTVMDFLAWVGGVDIDDPKVDLDIRAPQEFVRFLSACTGQSVERIGTMNSRRRQSTLAKQDRRSFCPFCWDEDIDGGTAPYVRLDWIDAWCVHCSKHQCNLVSVHSQFEPSLLPFMGSVWSNDIEWASAAQLPFTRRFIQRHLTSHDDFKARLRRELIDPMQTWLPTAASHQLLWLETRAWFRYLFNQRSKLSRATFRGVPTPLSVVSDLIAFSGYRFAGADPLCALANRKPSSFGWSNVTDSLEWRSRREPLGPIGLRNTSFVFAYVLWEMLLGVPQTHDLWMYVRDWIPFAQTKAEVAWTTSRIQSWPRDWQASWADLITTTNRLKKREGVLRRFYRRQIECARNASMLGT